MNEINATEGTVFVIDDVPQNLKLLSDLLTQNGYHVRSFTSGKMALKALKIKKADIILLDIQMPEMDGYQVCEAMKADEDLRDIPIIFMSAFNDSLYEVKAFKCGGKDYITKPFQVEEVIARLENQLIIQQQKNTLALELKKRQETEEILYQSRALLSSILNIALDGIAALQAVRHPETGEIEDFRCLVVNPVIAKMFNQNQEDLIGQLVLKKFLERIDPDLFERFVKVVETGEPLEEDFCYQLENSYWYHFVAVKLGDGFAITVKDITQKKQIEIELQEADFKIQELVSFANLDGLTKVANRRYFDESLNREWRRLFLTQQPLSLIFLDVDYLRKYNDCYGLYMGDNCLIKIAETLQKVPSRPADVVARYGGEEFAILLPETDQPGAIIVAEKIRQEIQSLAIPHQLSTVSDQITVSMGITTLIPNLSLLPDHLTNLADQALFLAKQQGRNCYHYCQA